MLLTAVQHVVESTVQPRFTFHVVVPAVHRFIEHVRVLTSKAGYLLCQSNADLSHQFLVTSIPQLVSMG